MPVFMLAEPVILVISLVLFVLCLFRARKNLIAKNYFIFRWSPIKRLIAVLSLFPCRKGRVT